MNAVKTRAERRAAEAFRHEALLYAGEAQFVDAAAAFVRDGLAADEPVLVMVGASKLDALREELDGDTEGAHFADMGVVGANPARIIPAWREFVDEHGGRGRPLRGIGEPIWAGRTAAELVECQHHESLLNVAFRGTPFRLLCPYDTDALDPGVIEEARRSHPYTVAADGTRRRSRAYRRPQVPAPPLSDTLPEPPVQPLSVAFRERTLAALRRFVFRVAADAGVATERAGDVVQAVNELATNSVRHGGGRGVLRVWRDGDAMVFEIRDHGRIHDALVGRAAPAPDQLGGFGLWLAHQLCDLVQVRSSLAGNVVRLHMRIE